MSNLVQPKSAIPQQQMLCLETHCYAITFASPTAVCYLVNTAWLLMNERNIQRYQTCFLLRILLHIPCQKHQNVDTCGKIIHLYVMFLIYLIVLCCIRMHHIVSVCLSICLPIYLFYWVNFSQLSALAQWAELSQSGPCESSQLAAVLSPQGSFWVLWSGCPGSSPCPCRYRPALPGATFPLVCRWVLNLS